MTTPEQRELSGQVAVVTGASSGIGRAIAIALAEAGADVLVHAGRNRVGADETAETIRRMAIDVQSARQVEVRMADFTDEAAIEQFADAAWGWRGGVDIWVNNAGADILAGDSAKWSYERKLQLLWQVDVLATIRLSRLIGERMKARGRGVIINVGWDGADCGMEGDTGELFAATKGAVMAFSRSLAKSLAPEVRVNCMALGWIKTAWGQQASDVWQERAERESLLHRWGTPEDVAPVARFLASPAAGFLTGQIVNVNGGRA
jgi:3-oxoacyl-[acyl-carrier protein] reductase